MIRDEGEEGGPRRKRTETNKGEIHHNPIKLRSYSDNTPIILIYNGSSQLMIGGSKREEQLGQSPCNIK